MQTDAEFSWPVTEEIPLPKIQLSKTRCQKKKDFKPFVILGDLSPSLQHSCLNQTYIITEVESGRLLHSTKGSNKALTYLT